MRHASETEVKLQVRDAKRLKRRLRALGFRRVVPRHFERNILFDFEDLRLRKARCLLRLRFAKQKGILTFKTAPRSSPRYKIRGEIETEVRNGRRMKEILGKLGLCEVFRYEKYRTVFAQPNRSKKHASPTLVYDETPIGEYLELEGPERWIDAVARKLGYDRSAYITASYGTLYRRKCAEQGREPGKMTFRGHKG